MPTMDTPKVENQITQLDEKVRLSQQQIASFKTINEDLTQRVETLETENLHLKQDMARMDNALQRLEELTTKSIEDIRLVRVQIKEEQRQEKGSDPPKNQPKKLKSFQ